MKQQASLPFAGKHAQIQQAIIKTGIAQNSQSHSVASGVAHKNQSWTIKELLPIGLDLHRAKVVFPEGSPDWPEVTQMCYVSLAVNVYPVDDISIKADAQNCQEISAVNASQIYWMRLAVPEQMLYMIRGVAKTQLAGDYILRARRDNQQRRLRVSQPIGYLGYGSVSADHGHQIGLIPGLHGQLMPMSRALGGPNAALIAHLAQIGLEPAVDRPTSG